MKTETAQPTASPVMEHDSSVGHTLSTFLTLSMAVATGVAVANIYYNQPMLGVMKHDLPDPVTNFIPTGTQLGYAAGLFLLVPV